MDNLKKYVITFCQVLAFPVAFTKPMGEVELSDDEQQRMKDDISLAERVFQSSYSKSYIAWRRRLLWSAFFFYAIGVSVRISNILEQCDGFFSHFTVNIYRCSEEKMYTTLGKVTIFSQRIAPFCSLIVIFLGAWFWTDYSKSRNVLVPGWLLTMLLSLWPMVISLDAVVLNGSTFNDRVLVSAGYALGILPTHLSIIAGMTKGFTLVFQFAPSPLSGAMIVLSSVFALIIPFTGLSIIAQLLGDYLLAAGFSLIVLASFIILFGASLFTLPVPIFGSSQHIQKCLRLLRLSLVCRSIGFLLILAWAVRWYYVAKNKIGLIDSDVWVTLQYIEKFVDYKSIIGMTVEFIGGMMFNAVLWTDIAVHVARNDDIKMQKMQMDLSV